jgi:hypothetical protein
VWWLFATASGGVPFGFGLLCEKEVVRVMAGSFVSLLILLITGGADCRLSVAIAVAAKGPKIPNFDGRTSAQAQTQRTSSFPTLPTPAAPCHPSYEQHRTRTPQPLPPPLPRRGLLAVDVVRAPYSSSSAPTGVEASEAGDRALLLGQAVAEASRLAPMPVSANMMSLSSPRLEAR